MHFFKELSVIAVCIICAHAVEYRGGTILGSYAAPATTRNVYSSGAHNPRQDYPPQPYKFDYEVRDELGNMHHRQETGDQSGTVRGTYGYTDNQGLYRIVEYVADADGFRATVKSNEPGVGKEGPADVVLIAADPPAGIQEKYTLGHGGVRTYQAGVSPAGRGAGAAGAGAGAGGGYASRSGGGGYGYPYPPGPA